MTDRLFRVVVLVALVASLALSAASLYVTLDTRACVASLRLDPVRAAGTWDVPGPADGVYPAIRAAGC